RTNREVACTDEPAVTNIGYGKPAKGSDGIAFLRTTTLADELRAQLSPSGHVIAFSMKADAAAMLGGHKPDAVTWFDEGVWATSSAFAAAPSPVVAGFIERNPVEGDHHKVWDRALPIDAYLYEESALGVTPRRANKAVKFPHRLG